MIFWFIEMGAVWTILCLGSGHWGKERLNDFHKVKTIFKKWQGQDCNISLPSGFVLFRAASQVDLVG